MNTTSGEAPRYKVSWRRGNSQHRPFATFEGDGAFAQANKLYAELHADPGVTEIQLDCLEGGVLPLRRNDAGEWTSG
jgi:hypothetical protein